MRIRCCTSAPNARSRAIEPIGNSTSSRSGWWPSTSTIPPARSPRSPDWSSRAVVYTVGKFSPATIVSALTPLGIHHTVKKILWDTEERDTFPTVYKMNTRRALRRLFQDAGFRKESFRHLDDCRAFARWRWSSIAELTAWRCLKAVGLRYPEACILATYQRDY